MRHTYQNPPALASLTSDLIDTNRIVYGAGALSMFLGLGGGSPFGVPLENLSSRAALRLIIDRIGYYKLSRIIQSAYDADMLPDDTCIAIFHCLRQEYDMQVTNSPGIPPWLFLA